MRSSSLGKCWLAFLFGSLLCLQAQALVVQATATDIADTVAGQDQWQMRYRITGALQQNDALNLVFSPTIYGDLALGTLPAVLDPALSPGGGIFDSYLSLTALSDIADGMGVDAFVTFTRLDASAFPVQAFEVTDGDFNIVQSGDLPIVVGQANDVPEPASWMLLGLGLAALRARPRY